MSGLDTSQSVTDAASLGAEQAEKDDAAVSADRSGEDQATGGTTAAEQTSQASSDEPDDLDDFLGDATPDRGSV